MVGHFNLFSIVVVHLNELNPRIGLDSFINKVCNDWTCCLVLSTSKGDAYLKIERSIVVEIKVLVLVLEYLNTSLSTDIL